MSCRTNSQTFPSNEDVRGKFRQLHSKLVETINCDRVADILYSMCVIDSEFLDELHNESSNTKRARKLLLKVNHSSHPKAFIFLREAVLQDPNCQWLKDQIVSPSVVPSSPSSPSKSSLDQSFSPDHHTLCSPSSSCSSKWMSWPPKDCIVWHEYVTVCC